MNGSSRKRPAKPLKIRWIQGFLLILSLIFSMIRNDILEGIAPPVGVKAPGGYQR
jgi:hypothetical protein